jgi:imidazolonepropionase
VKILFKNIKQLVGVHNPTQALRGKELNELPIMNKTYLIVENGLIKKIGSSDSLDPFDSSDSFDSLDPFDSIIDCTDKTILPTWCDSHTHLVFAGSRENEFIDKLKGKTYAEIAASGGGILNSAHLLNETSEEILYEMAWQRLQELIRLGTGAIEIKSGYGLTVEGELKMLRVIQQLKANSPIPIKATFLGAHSFPTSYKEHQQAYIDLLIHKMLPTIGKENLADYVDVFCEKGFFTPQQMETICNAASPYGLKPKLHINQLNSIGGLQKAIELNAISVDHLETMTPQDIHDIAHSPTIGTLLPTAAYFLRMPFQPARQLIDAGAAIALASDYNPGSSPSGNINTVVSMSCIQMKMLPHEAINAATINGAFAMELQQEVGSITIGKKANFILTKPISSINYLPYAFGSNLIDTVFINGHPF